MFVLGDGYDSEVFFELLYQLCQHQAQYLFVVFGGIVVVYRRLPVSEHHGDESEGAAFVVAGDEPDVFRGCATRRYSSVSSPFNFTMFMNVINV